MSEHKRRMPVDAQGNGQVGFLIKKPRVRVVPTIRLQNVDADHVVMIVLGDKMPELCAALSSAEARTLAQALIQHADLLDKDAPRIIVP